MRSRAHESSTLDPACWKDTTGPELPRKLCRSSNGMLSIIIVSYNARTDLERCLESLHASSPALAHETIVVDNHSTDGSADAARRWTGVRVIENATNIGFAAANNVGIRASRGELLLLLNSDTAVPAGAIDRLTAALDAHADVAVIGPRLVDANGRPELSFGKMITPLNELRQKRLARSDAVQQLTRRRHYPDWVSGACLLVRREDAEAVGLLDERFFMYTEDVDFCAAIRARTPDPVRAGDRSCSFPRPVGQQRSGADRSRVPPQPHRLLRKAPPVLGPAAQAVFAFTAWVTGRSPERLDAIRSPERLALLPGDREFTHVWRPVGSQ